MPPWKSPGSLASLSSTSLVTSLAVRIRGADTDSKIFSEIQSVLSSLPIPLLEDVIEGLTVILIGKDKQTKSFFNAFKCFPLRNLTKLNFSRLFYGFRLSRTQNTEFKEFCVNVFKNTHYLRQLVLIAKCTNEILAQLGESCKHLWELNIGLSDDISDEGLLGLLPTLTDTRCSNLRFLDITKCWNISPKGAASVVTKLPKLQRLCYSSMRAMAEEILRNQEIEEVGGSYELDYFECTEKNYVLLNSKAMPAVTYPRIGFSEVFQMFPKISTIKVLVSDPEVQQLTCFTGLRHVEFELVDDPEVGFKSFFQDPCTRNLNQIVLQVICTPASYLQIIAENCQQLTVFKFTGTTIEGEETLCASKKYFQNLAHLEFKLFGSSEMYISSEEEEEEGEGGEEGGPKIKPEILLFFLQFSTQLVQISLYVNCSRFITSAFLEKLFQENNLVNCQKFFLSGPSSLPLDRDTVDLLLSTLPSLRSIHISRWEGITERILADYKNSSKLDNLDIEFF